MPPRTKYSDICALFASKDCRLLTDEAEYNENHMTKQDKYRYVARCGHESEVYCTNFINNSGIDCPKCASSKALEKSTSVQESRPSNKEIISTFISLIKSEFSYKLTSDKYILTDLFIRPKTNDDGLWLRILIRYSASKTNLGFSANNEIQKYVLVGMTSTNRTWVIPSTKISGKRLRIDIEIRDQFTQFEVKSNQIINVLKKCYENENLVSTDDNVKYSITGHNIMNVGNGPLDFEEIVRRFADKQCEVLTTKNEFIEQHMHTKDLLSVKMNCEHIEDISLACFQKRKFFCCQKCIFKQAKTSSYNETERVAIGNLSEATGFIYIKDILQHQFVVMKTHEGCKCDFAIKPISVKGDEWIGVQLKTMTITTEESISQYAFGKIGKYSGNVILCIVLPIKKMWMFDGAEFAGRKNGLSIGKKQSKYEANAVTVTTIVSLLQNKYVTSSKYKLEELNIPTSVSQQKEHSNRLIREKLLNNKFTLDYPIMDGTKYDIKINGFKVQDKCVQKVKDVNSYFVRLGSMKRNYKKGDNDFYWINMPNSDFYIFPENVLLNNNGIVHKITLNKKHDIFYFSANDPDLITKLEHIFTITDVAASHGY